MATSSSRVRIGVVMANQGATVDGITQQLVELESLGFDSAWMPGIPNGPDVLTLLAIAGRATTRIQVGTAVVPTYPRHPIALAAQALTVNTALGGRLTLGIGVSHQVVIERQYGLDYAKPASHLREYLQVLRPLLETQSVDFAGEHFRARIRLAIETGGVPPPSVIIAALAPRMLQLAGELADGTVTFMFGPVTTRDHIVPGITAAAAAAGRPAPRVVLGIPVLCTDDPAAGRAQAAQEFAIYAKLPAYRAMMDHEGAAGPQDLVLVGNEAVIAAAVEAAAAAGVTDFQATPFGDPTDVARTIACLAMIQASRSHDRPPSNGRTPNLSPEAVA
jgi:5,10-methylenetetrahydromethanopterin reductase